MIDIFVYIMGVACIVGVFSLERQRRQIAQMDSDELHQDFERWLISMRTGSHAHDPDKILKLVRSHKEIMMLVPLFGAACLLLVLALPYYASGFLDIGLVLVVVSSIFIAVQTVRYWRTRLGRFEQLIADYHATGSPQTNSIANVVSEHENKAKRVLSIFTTSPPDPAVSMVVITILFAVFELALSIIGTQKAVRLIPSFLIAGLIVESFLILRQRQATKEDWLRRLGTTRPTTFLGKVDSSSLREKKRPIWLFYLAPLLIAFPFLLMIDLLWPLIMKYVTIIAIDACLLILISVAAVNLIVFDLQKLDYFEKIRASEIKV